MNDLVKEKIKLMTTEVIEIVEYDSNWPVLYEEEKEHLLTVFPDLVISIAHIGSTAVQGMAAKPVVDMLIEINDVQRGKIIIPEILEPKGYDCFWRPTSFINNKPPYYTWCVRRNDHKIRTHHLHFVAEGEKKEGIIFRNILRENSEIAKQYVELKKRSAMKYKDDRIQYTASKGSFIRRVLGDFGKTSLR